MSGARVFEGWVSWGEQELKSAPLNSPEPKWTESSYMDWLRDLAGKRVRIIIEVLAEPPGPAAPESEEP